jgi:group I intron endonuclease
MNKPYGIIYRATNVINGKCYIGQTAGSLNDRKNTHIRYAYRKNSMCIFHRALRKYGIQNFIWEILCECESKPILNVIETFKIIVNNSHWTENGYNMTWGGDGVPFGNKPWNKGIKKCFSEEALLKSRKSHQKHSDESIEKIRELRKQGYSWKKISNITSIPDRTIRDYCKDY